MGASILGWRVPGRARRPTLRGDGNSMKWLIAIGMLVVSLLAPMRGGWLGPVGQPVSVAGAAPADTTGTLTVNGYDRHYLYVVSAAAAPAAGRPLVIFLHGDGGAMGLS